MGLTRKELRRAVGRNLRALSTERPTIQSDEDEAASLPYTLLHHRHDPAFGAGWAGFYAYFEGQESLVRDVGNSDTDVLQGVLKVHPQLTGYSSSDPRDTAELWNPTWPPSEVNDFINQAITDARRRIYTNLDPIYECVTPRNREFTLGSDVAMVQQVYKRQSFDYRQVYYSETSWESTVGATEIAGDYQDFRHSPSVRFDLGAGAQTLSLDISSTYLTGMTHIEGWFKTTLSDLGFTIRLKDGTETKADFAEETLDSDDNWQYLLLEIPTRYAADEIDGVDIVLDAGGGVFWTNGLWAVNHHSVNWQAMHRAHWRIDQNTRTLVIQPPRSASGSGPFGSYGFSVQHTGLWPINEVKKIIVGGDPQHLDSDDDTTEVPDQFIIARATQLGYSAPSGGPSIDPRRLRQQAAIWEGRVEREYARFQPLMNVRRLN